MTVHPTQLELAATRERVVAELHDALILEDLLDAQALWAPAKIAVAKEFLRRNVARAGWPQSLHWDWAEKAAFLKTYAPGPLSPFRLFGMRVGLEWQGMLLGSSYGHKARIGAPGRDLVYVEFVETAPWNWRLDAIEQKKKYNGVGLQLFELAVRWSDDLGYKGRVGLHSLPQSNGFYRGTCAMTDLGEDPKNPNQLNYFELDEKGARSFLEEDEQ